MRQKNVSVLVFGRKDIVDVIDTPLLLTHRKISPGFERRLSIVNLLELFPPKVRHFIYGHLCEDASPVRAHSRGVKEGTLALEVYLVGAEVRLVG